MIGDHGEDEPELTLFFRVREYAAALAKACRQTDRYPVGHRFRSGAIAEARRAHSRLRTLADLELTRDGSRLDWRGRAVLHEAFAPELFARLGTGGSLQFTDAVALRAFVSTPLPQAG